MSMAGKLLREKTRVQTQAKNDGEKVALMTKQVVTKTTCGYKSSANLSSGGAKRHILHWV